MLSVRPLVNWSGYDMLGSKVYDPEHLPVTGWAVAAGQIGVQIQSTDRAGGAFRNDAARWVSAWERSEPNPSGLRSYNGTEDARTLQVDVLAFGNRNYAIWVSCRAFVLSQSKFGVDTRASSSISCQLPLLFVEETEL